jgi:hypothetical protein
MTETQRTNYRLALLMQLHAIYPEAMTLESLHIGNVATGIKCRVDETKGELIAMEEAGFIRSSKHMMNATQVRYTRTEAGRVELSDNNLI